MCLFAICKSSLVMFLFKLLALFKFFHFNWVICLITELKDLGTYSRIQVLCQICVWQIVSHERA